MLCQDCRQRVSTVIYTEVREGSKKVLHLCQACVEKRGIPAPVLRDPLEVEALFKDLLQQLGEEEGAHGEMHQLDSQNCAVCGWSFQDFQESGMLGCPQCYTAFEEALKHLLKQLHGSDEHLGRKYELDADQIVSEEDEGFLKNALEEAVKREEFEQAAQIRDRLNQIQKDSGDG
jgi:protein arginine kinase activator